MNLTELQQIHPDATPETWHQHPNGGGWVQNTATVAETAYVGPDAHVYGNARVYGSAHVYGGEWEASPLYVQGSWYAATNCAPGEIQIGCKGHPFAWWRKHGLALARREGFTPERVKEYRAIVNLITAHGR